MRAPVSNCEPGFNRLQEYSSHPFFVDCFWPANCWSSSGSIEDDVIFINVCLSCFDSCSIFSWSLILSALRLLALAISSSTAWSTAEQLEHLRGRCDGYGVRRWWWRGGTWLLWCEEVVIVMVGRGGDGYGWGGGDGYGVKVIVMVWGGDMVWRGGDGYGVRRWWWLWWKGDGYGEKVVMVMVWRGGDGYGVKRW